MLIDPWYLTLAAEELIFKHYRMVNMKNLLVLLILLGSYSVNAQKIKFKIADQPDTTVYLVKYFGKNLFYADTAEIKNGIVNFDGTGQDAGIMALYIPNQSLLEFVYNNEKEIYIEAKGPNYMSNAVAKKSEENKIFLEYVQFIASQKSKSGVIDDKRKDLDKDSDEYKKLTAEYQALSDGVENRQKEIAENHSDMLVGKIIRMSMEVDIPEPPVDESGRVIDSNFRFNYFRDHYWDNIDLNDDRLVRTPVFDNKLSHYFSNKMMVQHWDTIIKYAFNFIDRLDPESDMFQYVVSNLTSKYEKSKIMGMNKVFVHLGKKYYCTPGPDGKPLADWMTKDKRDKLCEKVNTHMNLVMGEVPPFIRLRDTTDVKWHDFMSLKSEYTILYFWDPDCGHCKKITPKLETLYSKKWKDRDIEIFAVGKATGDDFEKWKAFIKKHNLSFINVAVTKSMYEDATDQTNNQEKLRKLLQETTIESLNYQQHYDIFATPKVWVLDKDKKIIAYSLTVSQLEDMLDKLQKQEDSEKLFPPEDDVEDEQMH